MQLHIYRCKSKEELLAQIKKNFSYVSVIIFDNLIQVVKKVHWFNLFLNILSIISLADSGEKRRRGLYPL